MRERVVLRLPKPCSNCPLHLINFRQLVCLSPLPCRCVVCGYSEHVVCLYLIFFPLVGHWPLRVSGMVFVCCTVWGIILWGERAWPLLCNAGYALPLYICPFWFGHGACFAKIIGHVLFCSCTK